MLAAGATLAVAEPAAASFFDCPVGTGCVWSGPDATGTKTVLSFSGSGGIGHCVNLTRTVDSIYSTYGAPVGGIAIYTSSNCASTPAFYEKGTMFSFGAQYAFPMKSYLLTLQ